ncbi:BMP family ABC transporter substrate-binding protein [Oceanobacillus halophilus]|uniref:BMP family ABC transporter substrate-binding protein n=1 Tax=Oceanobacillus halophilus TaxID=930130 RepID=A0A495A397_9BACI|nr:BMP family ABC transporter substrate-binding protein [Oceanobacillus halophilus]RKQ32619.1 BMP family ABC transporter substrate-binding protein [Oceanobacillus halophilus]
MKLYHKIILLFIVSSVTLSGCGYFETGNVQNVGMLLDSKIEGNAWNESGYEGLLRIEKKFDTDVYYKENIDTERKIRDAVDELVHDGVNLIFGHSSIYGNHFSELARYYPDVHFVYFNGGIYNDNVTSLNFNSHAMGFIGGMVAAEMTKTNKVGVIAAYLWQPEIEGFYEGVKYQNPSAVVEIDYIKSWDDTEMAVRIYEEMENKGVDVFYPIGDAYSEEIIKKAKEDSLYAVGYVEDQLKLAPDTVLTSTIQQLDKLYELTAEKFDKGKLEGDILTFDFQDEVISIGAFNKNVPEEFQEYINETVEYYMDSNLLPNEQ